MKHTKWLGSIALSVLLLTGFSGCDSSSSDDAETVTPYQRIAIIPGTWAEVPEIANQIATYVVETDESVALGYPTNWVIAGANPASGETYETTDLLPIPANGVASAKGKSRVIEFCNGAYATMATNTGRFHGSALPCEVSVHSDGENIYVDMLDADAIFTIFFADIVDTDGGLEAVASAVKGEIRGMVLASLTDQTVSESTEQMGPEFNKDKLGELQSPYLVMTYAKADGSAFVKGDDKILSAEIIAKLGTDTATADTNVAGLSEGSAWRSGREAPLAIPGVQVAEACSPKYAGLATTLGNQYITALPCEITTYIDSQNDDTNKTLGVSILSPEFMFEVMFQGAVANALAAGTLDENTSAAYATLATTVRDDLQTIVNAAIADSILGLVKK